ncbi:MarR family winged helix-turn-helix transcriptional regulator [Oricola indica]|uniref:MarR family winged helix-turn-helix transcriptional regulator n=1 Tax=Oricola indica TaxID=2872591 RepID=UPI003CCBFA8B
MKNDLRNSLGFLLHDAQRLLHKHFEARGQEYGLSSAQWRLLVFLVKEDGAAQARLAELLEIEPISVSRLIDRMEEGGWVERRADANDRRVRMVFATRKARDAFEKVKSVASDLYEIALAGLSPAERETLMHALRTVCDNLSDGKGASDGTQRGTGSAG